VVVPAEGAGGVHHNVIAGIENGSMVRHCQRARQGHSVRARTMPESSPQAKLIARSFVHARTHTLSLSFPTHQIRGDTRFQRCATILHIHGDCFRPTRRRDSTVFNRQLWSCCRRMHGVVRPRWTVRDSLCLNVQPFSLTQTRCSLLSLVVLVE
jgi:hypothetical protein